MELWMVLIPGIIFIVGEIGCIYQTSRRKRLRIPMSIMIIGLIGWIACFFITH